jgi:hypothetical protein
MWPRIGLGLTERGRIPSLRLIDVVQRVFNFSLSLSPSLHCVAAPLAETIKWREYINVNAFIIHGNNK